MANTIDHNHGSTGEQPPDALDFATGDFPDPEVFDWFWNQTVTTVNDHAAQLDAIDSNGDGKVDQAEVADSASSYKGNDIDSNGDGKVDSAEYADQADTANTATEATRATATAGASFIVNADIKSSDGVILYDDTDDKITTDALPDNVGGNWPTHFDETEPPVGSPGDTWVELLPPPQLWSNSGLLPESIAVSGSDLGGGNNNGEVFGYTVTKSGATESFVAQNHSSGTAVSGAAIGEDPNTSDVYLYSGGADGTVRSTYLVTFDHTEGGQVWSHSLHSGAVNAVALGNSDVYSAGEDNAVVAADYSDGTEAWTHTFHSNAVRAITTSNTTVYSGDAVGTIVAATSTGSENWTSSPHSGDIVSIAANNDHVFSLESDGTIYATNTVTGTDAWSASIPYISYGGITVSNGIVYAAGGDEGIYTFEAATGDPIYEANVSTTTINDIAVTNGFTLLSTPSQIDAYDEAPQYQLYVSDGYFWRSPV